MLQPEVKMGTFHWASYLSAIATILMSRPILADDAADKIDDSLLAKLQGEWNPVSVVFDGGPFPGDAPKTSVVFEGRTMLIRIGDRVAGRVDIKHLVTEGEFGNIDYEIRDPAGNAIRTKQLFKLEGDTLTTCVRSPPGERPRALTSKPGSKHLLTVSQRKRKDTQTPNR